MTYTMTPRPESKAAKVVGHPCVRGSEPAAASRGFTLIEMMITVAVIGILSAIAYPSYRQYVIRANRSAAQGYMLNVTSRQEQYLLDNRQYLNAPTEAALEALVPMPDDVDASYAITVAANNAATPPTFTVTAAPVGAQASDVTLTINSAGVKTPADKW